MYDSYGLELCIMYDSYGAYLCILWTICMYKFSRCHVVVFSQFFSSIYRFLTKISRFLTKNAQISPHRFSEKSADLSAKPADLSVFPVSVFLRISGAFRLNFLDFCRFLLNFSKTDGIDDVRFS
jgi:hypothetical protein